VVLQRPRATDGAEPSGGGRAHGEEEDGWAVRWRTGGCGRGWPVRMRTGGRRSRGSRFEGYGEKHN
jgi:hypothetical protein